MVKLISTNYLKVDDVKEGDIITFKDAGAWVESTKYTYDDGTPKKQFVMTVDYNGAEKSMRVNKFSRDELVKSYGDDTDLWVGKQAKITIEVYRSLNTRGIILLPVGPTAKKEENIDWD